MAELIAVGPEVNQRWQYPLPEGKPVRLGRAPRQGWKVPWDALISREHCDLQLEGCRLKVKRLGTARNSIYFRDSESAEFLMDVGETFRIGMTSFHLVVPTSSGDTHAPVEEHAYAEDELKRFEFRNADLRLEVLSKLPHAIADSHSDDEFAAQLVELILEAIPHAHAAAAVIRSSSRTSAGVTLSGSLGSSWSMEFDIDGIERRMRMQWSGRDPRATEFRPSRRLIREAINREKSLLHVWHGNQGEHDYTISGDLDWAFCTPIKGEACRGWCLYVSGRTGSNSTISPVNCTDDLRGDLRFTELIAQFISAIRQARLLQEQQNEMSQFFSPAVIETMKRGHTETTLVPSESEITVLFCDLRGFSRRAERDQDDLLELMARVSEALSVMTRGIIQHEGIIADFQGDAALGFWGWPTPPEDGPLPACRAALAIHEEFSRAAREKDTLLEGFRVGIGVAHGKAIAGKIGTVEQAKVGVFGPVVNLGSRLEGMTKQLRVPILIDEATAEYVRRCLPPSEGRCRKLGRVRPHGMDTPLTVSELLPPESEFSPFSDQHIADYESAVDAIVAGRWDDALHTLDRLPITDRAKDFLTIFVAQNGYEAPAGWDGVIDMLGK